MEELIKVRIISPQQVIFSGEALSISSTNSAGNFDILPQHANFITLIKNTPVIIRIPDKKIIKFNFPLAIIYAFDNQCHIYTNISLNLRPN